MASFVFTGPNIAAKLVSFKYTGKLSASCKLARLQLGTVKITNTFVSGYKLYSSQECKKIFQKLKGKAPVIPTHRDKLCLCLVL